MKVAYGGFTIKFLEAVEFEESKCCLVQTIRNFW